MSNKAEFYYDVRLYEGTGLGPILCCFGTQDKTYLILLKVR